MQMSLSQSAKGRVCDDVVDTSARFQARTPIKIRIGWVSVSRLTRECMVDVVGRAHPAFEILPFDTTYECVTHFADPLDLVVYHSRGQSVTDLQELTELRRVLRAVKLLVLSDSVTMEPALMQRLLAEGTSGIILTTSNSLEMLISAIRLVSSGGTFVSREFFMTDRQVRQLPSGTGHRGLSKLTQRERSVLELIRHGKPNKIIAHELGLSLCTVKVHARNLIRKMGAANRTQAAMNAEKLL